MKNIFYHPVLRISTIVLIVLGIYACEEEFLEKPLGADLTVDSIFSSSIKVQAAIAYAYNTSLLSGLPGRGTWTGDYQQFRESTISAVSGEINPRSSSWQDQYKIARNGMSAYSGGRAMTEDGFKFNYQALRHCFLVIESIDDVPDLSSTEKAQIKAEMKTLIAYRYEEMFKRYGGVPIVSKSLSVADTILIPRATLQETLNHIVKLCDEVVAVLPDSYPATWHGRVTKGVALAVKAEALIFAARPLFNSSSPVLNIISSDESAGDNLICFGSYDQLRWQQAADASKAVIDWALANGHEIINTGNPLDDYGKATSEPSNKEVLLAYKSQYGSRNSIYTLWNIHSGYQANRNMMRYNQLIQYYKQDGTDQTWAGEVWEPYTEFYNKMEEMEGRYKASAIPAGMDAWNNPADEYWKSENLPARNGSEGCGRRAKFWWHAGRREWMEYPIYRLAEFYLYCAEGHNEAGQTALSQQYLNVIRDRAGLPYVTETDKTLLRKIIQREHRIEFFEEGHCFFDVRHWKLDNIGTEIIGGPSTQFMFEYTEGRNSGYIPEHYVNYRLETSFNGFWAPNQFFLPFPQNEINKGYLVQNPGY